MPLKPLLPCITSYICILNSFLFNHYLINLLITSAAALMTPKVSRSLSMKIDMPGATAPLGFFDPLGFTKGANAATLSKYREAEIKHGRVAMLAVFGILTAEKFHPLYDGKLSGNPLEAWANVPQLAKLQIFLFCGFLEFIFNQVKKNENYKVLHSLTLIMYSK